MTTKCFNCGEDISLENKMYCSRYCYQEDKIITSFFLKTGFTPLRGDFTEEERQSYKEGMELSRKYRLHKLLGWV